jgi:hypothetical protein
MLRSQRSNERPQQKKSLTIPRLTAPWNLGPSRARVINPGDACGDDDNASPINGLRRKPPSAMMLINPSRPACVQKNTFFNARRQREFLLAITLPSWLTCSGSGSGHNLASSAP